MIFVTLSVLLICCSITVADDTLMPIPSGRRMRGCYFTNWAQYRPGQGKFYPGNYVPGLCTHIFYAFAFMNDDCTVEPREWNDESTAWSKGQYEKVNDLKISDPGLKTLLSVGGWTFGTRLFKKMTSSATYRKAFLDSSITLLRRYNFDGLDIDWEYPKGDDDKANFVTFLQEARGRFQMEKIASGKAELLLTIAASAGLERIRSGYNVAAVAQAVDYVNIMAYDFHGAWEDRTDMNSPLFPRPGETDGFEYWDVSYAADYWNSQGTPKKKIAVGLPNYGRGWTLQNPANHGVGALATGASTALPYTREAGTGNYYEFCALLQEGATRYWNAVQKQPYLVKGNQWYSYDDVESFTIKLQWILSKGFGGAFVWSLDNDDFHGTCFNGGGQKYPLTSLMATVFSGGAPPFPGTTSAGAVGSTTGHNPPTTTTRFMAPTSTRTPTSTSTRTPTSTSTRATTSTSTRAPTSTSTITTTSTSTRTPTSTSTRATTSTSTRAPTVTSTRAAPTSGEPTTVRPSALCIGKSDGFYAASADCTSFIECYRHVDYQIHCPSPLYYSSSKHMCVANEESDCPVPPTTNAHVQPTTTLSGGAFQCQHEGIQADPETPCKFYICSHGVAYSFDCPNATEYVPTDETCEKPAVAHC